MTYRLLPKSELQQYFDEFIPNVKTHDITNIIHDYYQFTQLYKEFIINIKKLINLHYDAAILVNVFSIFADDELALIIKFLTPIPAIQYLNFKYCILCKHVFFHGVELMNQMSMQYSSHSNICNSCERYLCPCQTILYKDIFDYIYNTKTKKCHLCKQLKCNKHFFTSSDDTICLTCSNLFSKFMKTL